ncbi:MAG: Ribose-5-phosphate isomerase B [Syntrophus sp. PtaU1.Bin005]|jgi:ribose 5-phosphate isomerase B|uniref:ribose 5-phosphate isomerase B n=1 Tax=Syntrophus TaxID=43773 RepID=UPI0009D23FE7|nr:MAG: Ribose-5-phosphate isomerase B [Syntrophus sp. PtaB.Bin138]OPY82645.1 MAG: Ribose-5-phosphate isomerase B [Syntrophus sp. PtaU1.Bin005]
MAQTIIIGADHAGFLLKEEIKSFLEENGWIVQDVGTDSETSVDYPDYGAVVAKSVASGLFARGILVCGSGVGMAIVANKFAGIRAAVCLDTETARLSRLHNDTNILILAGRRTRPETAREIVAVWLETPFEGGRHRGRLDKIRALEDARSGFDP